MQPIDQTGVVQQRLIIRILKHGSFPAALLFLSTSLWMLSGHNEKGDDVSIVQSVAVSDFRVQVQQFPKQQVVQLLTLNGLTAAMKSVDLVSEYSGTATKVFVANGALIAAAAKIIQLNQNALPAVLAAKRAAVQSTSLNYNSILNLHKKGLVADAALKSQLVVLRNAQASVATTTQQLKRTLIKSPFAGVLERFNIEVGQYVDSGDVIGTVNDFSHLKVNAVLSEKEVFAIRNRGVSYVDIVFAAGVTQSAVINHISTVADNNNRGFALELLVNNPPERLKIAGVSVEISIAVKQIDAAILSPALFSLNNLGEIGIKYVDTNNKVAFLRITVLGTQPQGAQVIGEGLFDKRIITSGQGFVKEGQTVVAVAVATATGAQ